ncbi:MAG: rod shape-determining protein MreD [Fibromonadaceae bacterium]|jgi:rod shape-determining protein MreD|nr:rod shape-determining protein MreD [Fibromonadaceae bacterium]
MVNFILYSILFFVAAILQTVIVPQIQILEAQPSFLFILTVIAALRHGTLAGCLFGFFSGLLCDVYGPIEWFGAFSLAYCVIGFAVGQIEESFIDLNLLPEIIVLTVAYFIKDLIYFIAIGKKSDEILQAIIYTSGPNAIYTLSIGVIFFYLLSLGVKKKINIYK